MEKSATFYKSINPTNVNGVVDYWYDSTSFFDQKKYKESFTSLLKYIDSTVSIGNENSENLDIQVSHGSVMISIKVENGKYLIKAPFIKNPEGGSGIGLMREIAELNFSYLVLAQIHLEGDNFYISYQDNLENCEPYKVYAIFEEICYCADYYDDLFIDKFKTNFVTEPKVNHFSTEEKKVAHEKFNTIIKEGLEYAEFFDSKRLHGLACDALETALMKIKFSIAPGGILGIKLGEIKTGLFADDSFQNLSNIAKTKLREIQSFDSAKFDECMFYSKYFIPVKKRAEIPFIHSYLSTSFQTMTSDLGSKSYMNVSHSGTYMIYSLLSSYSIPNNIYDFLISNLEKSSNKPWKESAEIIYEATEKVMKLDPENPANLDNTSTAIVKNIFGKITGLFKN